MKTKLMMMGALAVACAVHELAAMPTEQETRRAEPAVKRLLLQQRTELRSGRKTRSEVAAAAMELAGETDTEAAKLLLMKGAFVLYVRDGNLEKAAETMNVLKKTIPDLPQESVKNMVETALKGAPENVDGERLRKLLGEAKAKNNGPAGSGDRMATVDGYTWSYRVRNGEATIVAEKDGKHSCAVSPAPTGDLKIPATLGGVTVTSIDKDAFHSCNNLTSVTMPDSVASIGENAFYGCSNLKSTVLPKYLTIISNSMFDWCTSLTDVTIPDPVTSIGNGAFFRCAFTDITIPNTVTNIGTFAFGWCTELKSVNIPDSVTRVGAHSFSCCQGLASLKMPGRLPHIEDFAFNGCLSLASVAIPGSVTNISTCAFQGCSSLTNVTMLGERPEAKDDIFKGCGKLKAIHVPANAKSWAGMKDWFGIPIVVDGVVSETFSLNAAPGSVTELGLGDVPPLQFVYCPAGKFSMGYKDQPAISKVKDIEITAPFLVSKTPIRADQLESLGLNAITNTEAGAAVIKDASIVVKELPDALKARFGEMLPSGYVFRLPTEAELEYLQKAGTKDGDDKTNIWGVEGLYTGGIICVLDRAPAYGRGVDVVNRKSRGTVWTDLEKVSYENQPDKDPVGWSDDPNWSVFRRGLDRGLTNKWLTSQGGKFHNCFYFVVAPDIDKLNKFYWK